MSSFITMRQASLADVDEMTRIALVAMPMDPQWNWRFPGQDQYPEDTFLHTRAKYQEFLENKDGNWRVMIAELKPTASQKGLIIAFAIWNVTNFRKLQARSIRNETEETLPTGTSMQLNARRDGHSERMKIWTKEMQRARETLFDDVLGENYLQLQVLATDPQFQRLGAGTLLCKWGIKMADLESTPAAVFASPMGQRLYTSLGFHSLSNVLLQAKDDNECISIAAMVYFPNS